MTGTLCADPWPEQTVTLWRVPNTVVIIQKCLLCPDGNIAAYSLFYRYKSACTLSSNVSIAATVGTSQSIHGQYDIPLNSDS